MQFRVFSLAVLFSTLLITSCGGGGSDGSSDDSGEGDPGLTQGSSINASLKPLLNSDGAEAGLAGCMNRGLYVNGPHTVTVTQQESIVQPYWDTIFNDELSIEEQFNVIDLSAEGIAQVDVTQTTFRSLNGTSVTAVIPYTVEGYQRRIVGASRDMPNPNPYIEHFNLEEGVSIPQAINVGTPTAQNFMTRVDTYVGREEITIAGRVVKTCRVDSTFSQDSDQPQFRLLGEWSTWFGLGTGLELRRDSVSYPDSEQDTRIATTILTTAVINGEKIY